MNAQALINRAEAPLPRSKFGIPMYQGITTFSGVVDENGVLHISGMAREQLLRSLLVNLNGKVFSDDALITVAHEVSRLCDEHHHEDSVGFDDLSAAIDRALSEREEALRALDERFETKAMKPIGVTAEEKAAVLEGLAYLQVDHLAGAV